MILVDGLEQEWREFAKKKRFSWGRLFLRLIVIGQNVGDPFLVWYPSRPSKSVDPLVVKISALICFFCCHSKSENNYSIWAWNKLTIWNLCLKSEVLEESRLNAKVENGTWMICKSQSRAVIQFFQLHDHSCHLWSKAYSNQHVASGRSSRCFNDFNHLNIFEV